LKNNTLQLRETRRNFSLDIKLSAAILPLMITIMNRNDRGRAEFGWLHSRHSFSFGQYYNPDAMGYRSLRVINEDVVEPGQGFGTHPHRDMEILTYVLEGQLAHKDSMGNGRVIQAGELQAMSAGRGISHSEFNASDEEPVHFLQIWIVPDKAGVEPRYAEWQPSPETADQPLTLLASPNGDEGSVPIHQKARLYLGRLAPGQSADFELSPKLGAWIQVMRGKLRVLEHTLQAGDGASIVDEAEPFSLSNPEEVPTEFLLFELE
jgi:hypothetical protein